MSKSTLRKWCKIFGFVLSGTIKNAIVLTV